MKGDVQIYAAVCSAAGDYGMNSGFYLITQSEEVFTVVFELIDRLMHISQRRVPLLLLERAIYLWPPALGQLLEGAHIQVAIVKECFQPGHVFG